MVLKLLTLFGYRLQRNHSYQVIWAEEQYPHSYEKQSPGLQRQLSFVFVRKAFGGDFESCSQWLRAQKATEKATGTLAAI